MIDIDINISIEPILIAVLNFLVDFLESAFRKDPRLPSSTSSSTSKDSKNGNGNDNGFFNSSNRNSSSNSNKGEQNQHLQEALKFMELDVDLDVDLDVEHESTTTPTTPTTPATRIEQVKKQYKRLSLRYHPDRNQGSKESQELMQKLNASFDLIEQYLEGGVGSANNYEQEEEEEQDKSSESSEEEEEPGLGPGPGPEQRPEQRRRRRRRPFDPKSSSSAARKKEKNKADDINYLRRRRQREMHEQMERELQQEQEQRERQRQRHRQHQRKLKLKQQMQQQKEVIRQEACRFTDLEQREAANRMFMDQVRLATEERQEKGNNTNTNTNNTNNTNTNTNHNANHTKQNTHHPETAKPKNYMMDSCTHDLIVAMRMDQVELLVELLNEAVDQKVASRLRELKLMASMRIGYENVQVTAHTLGLKEIRSQIMTKRLDPDHNTLLHYAVYFESPAVIRSLCYMAQHDDDGQLERILLLAKNIHGQIPMDFCAIAKDPDIQPLMRSLHDLVHLYFERTRMVPALKKAGSRLMQTATTRLDISATSSTVLGFLLGRYGFGCSTLLSLVGVFVLQGLSRTTELWEIETETETETETLHDAADIASLLSFLLLWKLMRTLFHFICTVCWVLSGWELALIVVPFSSFCCYSSSCSINNNNNSNSNSNKTNAVGIGIVTTILEAPLIMFGYLTTLLYIPFHKAMLPSNSDSNNSNNRNHNHNYKPRMRMIPKRVVSEGLTRIYVLACLLAISSSVRLIDKVHD